MVKSGYRMSRAKTKTTASNCCSEQRSNTTVLIKTVAFEDSFTTAYKNKKTFVKENCYNYACYNIQLVTAFRYLSLKTSCCYSFVVDVAFCIGSGWASVLNTQSSRLIKSSSENSRYKYFKVSAKKKLCCTSSY